MTTWLVDTGPLVAYLDSSDASHEEVVQSWDPFSGRVATTSAVITEAMHFVSSDPNGPRALADLISASGIEVFDLCAAPELREAALLMEKYSDTPMDFADASLVLLGEALSTGNVLTLDRRGFRTYRTRRNRPFNLVLDSVQ